MPSQSASHTEVAERISVGGDEITFRVTSDATQGAVLAVEVAMPSGGGPPALHRHDAEEIYRLERGELAIYLEDDEGEVRRHRATAGMTIHIPSSRAHTIRNESDAEARAYVVFAPGTEMERFIRAAGHLAGQGPPQIDDVLALAERHGITMTGPVPAGA
jgi:oxalate decarboxylase/phosphoglucose isomerase-like protein (cupin superfamily)